MKGKIIAILFMILFTILIATGVKVNAKSGDPVRVSTEKQLKAAMKNADAGTIIFRTEAYINVTIKPVKGSDEIFLIIDAPNASFNNKAVFAEINIMNARSFTESVSGNKIAVTGQIKGLHDYIPGTMFDNSIDFTVAKKKQVESLTIYDDSFTDPKYTLHKGAKVKNLTLVYDDGDVPIESTYDSSKRLLSLKYTNVYFVDESLKVKLDKSGRIIKIGCKAKNSVFDYEYAFTYDSNGKVIKMTGEHDSGKFEFVYTYSSAGLLLKSERSGSYAEVWNYLYDDIGLLKECVSGDASSSDTACVYSYEYDKKGRITAEKYNEPVYGNYFENRYTYNSKGFQTKEEHANSSDIEYTVIRSYNKTGDLIKFTITSDGESKTNKYKYDELGNLIE